MVPNKQFKKGHNVEPHDCCPPCGPTPHLALRWLQLLCRGPRSHRQTVSHPSWCCHFRATKLFDFFGMIPSVFKPSGQIDHQTLKSSEDGIPTVTVNSNLLHMSKVGFILPAWDAANVQLGSADLFDGLQKVVVFGSHLPSVNPSPLKNLKQSLPVLQERQPVCTHMLGFIFSHHNPGTVAHIDPGLQGPDATSTSFQDWCLRWNRNRTDVVSKRVGKRTKLNQLKEIKHLCTTKAIPRYIAFFRKLDCFASKIPQYHFDMGSFEGIPEFRKFWFRIGTIQIEISRGEAESSNRDPQLVVNGRYKTAMTDRNHSWVNEWILSQTVSNPKWGFAQIIKFN